MDDIFAEHALHHFDTAAQPLNRDGSCDEKDVGGPVSFRNSMVEYESLQRELSHVSRTLSTRSKSNPRASALLINVVNDSRSPARAWTAVMRPEPVLEAPGKKPLQQENEDYLTLGAFLRHENFEMHQGGNPAKKVGVVFKHLTVKGAGATKNFVKTLPSAILGTFGPDLYKLLSKFITFLPRPGTDGEKRALIRDFTGVVRDREMLLVLGRPGSGCSTFLKAIANKRASFAEVNGVVTYGGISASEQLKSYRGEVIYNEEDDQHFPSLTVEQTLEFSLLNKTKKRAKGDIHIIISALLNIFGIAHTRHTLVGDAFLRGVSGGERQRVSVAETLTTKSTVIAWDNSTRGLDASTALNYAKSLRVMTNISDRTTLVTLYQAGEEIYELMDKVMVIDEGRLVYQGPAKSAKKYFEDLGYYCPERQTSADFLTACTNPTERQFRRDTLRPIPIGAAELETAFRESQAYQDVLKDVEAYEKMLQETGHADAYYFKQSVQKAKSSTVSKNSSYTVSFVRQVLACTKREFWLTIGDRTTLYTKFFIIISNALILGSLYNGQSTNTGGAFSRGGSLFISILFLGWLQMSELIKAMSGRPIVARHNDYALYRPSAVVVARVLQDFPMVLMMVIPFSIIMYFLTTLTVDAGKFFIYFVFVYVNTICLTALYRMFASISPSIDDAVRFSGTAFNILLIYSGYVISRKSMLHNSIWFGWLSWLNPVSYAFEAVITNEFYDRSMACGPSEVIPTGLIYADPTYQGCAFTGAELGSLNVPGSRYLSTAYDYSRDNLWRNFGIVVCFTMLYIATTMIASELLEFNASSNGAIEFKRTSDARQKMKSAVSSVDEEKAIQHSSRRFSETSSHIVDVAEGGTVLQEFSGSRSFFTWRDVEYTVPYEGGELKLLNKVSGYVKPGVLIALMGASGAGKTTLLNTLSQRQKTGVVRGEMLVNGQSLGREFRRGTGFCEQMDLHDGTATIREALEFSAILRQDYKTSKAEKIAYVDEIIDLLELTDMQDALIRSLGVEQRKRVTIGVELAAKPNLLLFLDEPTSGLDSQSAYSIVRFLKKLTRAGQAIVCTIHQPSSILIQQFDMILALNPGGHTFYFGPVGEGGSAVIKYFADRGVHCPVHKNVAEFMLDTAAQGSRMVNGRKLSWHEVWLHSHEAQKIGDEIRRLNEERHHILLPSSDVEGSEYASPVTLQIIELTKRMFKQQWRDPSYLYGKLFSSAIVGIFNGFTFWKLGYTISNMQDRMFSSFMVLLLPPLIVNAVVPKFYMNRALWEARELPSRIYGWVAFCTASVVSEIPMAIIDGTVYWVLWYWPTGLPTNSSTAGYVYFMTLLFFLFQASWGQWICAFAPSFTVISNVLPFFFIMVAIFNGVFRPFSQLVRFWRYWMYYVNPSTYWISGVLSATLRHTPVHCAADELAYFDPPPGSTCAVYAQDFLSSATGYLINPAATTACGYCPFRSAVDYLHTLNIEPRHQWRDLGIFLGFCLSNWALVYFFIYTVRIRWCFGLHCLSR